MNKLIAELFRLYLFPRQQGLCRDLGTADAEGLEIVVTPEILVESLSGEKTVALNLVSADDQVRAMVMSFEKTADWGLVAKLNQEVQETLALPAPAVSVSGGKGFQVWFSLAEPVSADQARAFLEGLRHRCLTETPAENIKFYPGADASGSAAPLLSATPAFHAENGKWSAFIDSTLGGLFVDEPWLEMAPNFDKQADMLAGLESIKPQDFQRALNMLQTTLGAEALLVAQSAVRSSEVEKQPLATAGRPQSTLNVGSNFSDPKRFLLAVMNDTSASAGKRIKAAKALLPYFDKDALK